MHDQKLVIFAFMAVHGPWHLVHVWEAWPKTHHFCVLGSFSWAIAHCFWIPRWFTRPMTLTKCLRGMTKNPSFSRFWAVSWAIVRSFGFRGDFEGPWHSVHVWQAWPKTHHFCELLPTVLEIWGDLHGPWHSVHVWEAWPKTCRFYIFGPFLWASPQFWVFGVIFKPMTLSTCLICMTKNLSFLRVWLFLWAIVHCLGF
jgi:hypothetical protein